MKAKIKKWTTLKGKPENRVYIDGVESLQVSAWLLESGEFDFPAFFELCNLLEAIVLRDQLLASPPALPGSAILDIPSHFISELIRADVLQIVDWPHHTLGDPASDELDKKSWNSWLNAHNRLTEALFDHGRGVHISSLFGVGAFQILGENLYPSVHNRRGYMEALDLRRTMGTLDALYHTYRRMSLSYIKDVSKVFEARSSAFIPIPPIPSLILSKVSNPREIVEETLHLRTRLGSVRQAFREYSARLSDESLPLNESLKALEQLKNVASELSKGYDEEEKQVIVEWKDFGDLVPDDIEIDADDVASLAKLFLGKPLEWITHRLTRRKFLPLYSLKKDAFAVNRYGAIVRRLWQVDDYEIQPSVLRAYELEADLRLPEDKQELGIPFSKGIDMEWNILWGVHWQQTP